MKAKALAVGVLLLAAPAGAQKLRSDSTVADAWRLENGLEVRTLHVPNARGVAVTLAFRAGSGYDPAGREGLSELLAELQFMSAAGDVPERTREEMTSLRPLGWESRPGTRLVRFTEIATQAQLAGVLQQTARRLAGVQVTDADLKAAFASVRRDAGTRLFGEPANVLYWRSALLARGSSDEQLMRQVSLQGLEKLTAKDILPLLKSRFQPGNASLALAGDLSGVDVRALVRALFGKLPGGPAFPDTVQSRLRGGRRVTPWKGIEAPVGVIAVESPALTDSLHPSFYLGMLITGPGIINSWGQPTPPLTSRFQYSIYDEPELVRFYPPVRADATDPDLLAGALAEQLQVVGAQVVEKAILDGVGRGVSWLLGDVIPAEVLNRLRADPSGLGTLSNGFATRALWMGDAFWADYLRRFRTQRLGHSYFYDWMADGRHQATLLLTPAR
jgi:peptidase M16-like protein